MKEHAIIIAGGRIEEDFALSFLDSVSRRRERSLLIAADRGLLFLDRNGIVPDLIVGEIDFLGTTGTRFDHVLGTVQLLAMLSERGVVGRIVDPYNRITIHQSSFRIRKREQWGKYVSLFAWGTEVRGVTLTGFHFPMENGRITNAETLTVSNEIENECAEVRFDSGMLMMVELKDTP